MASLPRLDFVPLAAPKEGVAILLTDERMRFGETSGAFLAPLKDFIRKAAAAEKFTGKSAQTMSLPAPTGLRVSRLILVGIGKGELGEKDLVNLGGAALGAVPNHSEEVTILVDLPGGETDSAAAAASIALGARLRIYNFDLYKTKRKEGEDPPALREIRFAVGDVAGAKRAWRRGQAIADGVSTARDFVNEPPNVVHPIEFAKRVKGLGGGLKVEILDENAMKSLGMNALLGVGLGSEHGTRLAIMRWDGGKRGASPIAFVGKGVTFDTGGISIKPAQGMEDMKGDMAGAACVAGLMQALAARKAKVNAVGVIGLAENMPDGRAQRPGDIVTSMSGQTIEIINTDAEGRLVLADALHYTNDRFKPAFMINLATLTGAIIVALGHEHAGMFTNNDELAARLTAAGEATGELVWRMPLGPEYDKMIDSKFADMKNTGGRFGGAITAAQFLQRFVGKTPWAHLDIAGTGFSSPQNNINKSWGSGFGVRLLDRLVADHYEG